MKFYFSIITQDHWTPKNKAHEEAKELFNIMARTLISEDEIEGFKYDLEGRLRALNARNKKCNDLILESFRRQDRPYGKVYFIIPGVVHMKLLEVQYVTNAARKSLIDHLEPKTIQIK